MLLERIYDEDLSQAGYLIACQSTGEALVVDPGRDVRRYLDLTAAHGLTIAAVTETHIHADYLSGTRELAEATGAQMYVSGEGGDDWQYGFDATRLNHDDVVTLGNVTIRAVHTPGHTPEHLSLLVTDGAFADEPGYMLTGDFVFAGDLGRPDLLDEAAGGSDDGEETRYEGARQIFASLRDQFLTLPDYVQVFPGHGAGSACGKSLGALPSTSVGYERRHAWWSGYLADDDEEGFVAELLDGQPDAPAYFGRMKRQNRDGPALLGTLEAPTKWDNDALAKALDEERVVVVDTRPHDRVHTGTVVGALNVPSPQKTASFGAWAYDPERESRPLVLLAEDQDQATQFRDHLLRVGIDTVDGYITDFDGLPTETPEVVPPRELKGLGADLVLDVRNSSEHDEGHIPGSKQLSAGRVLWNLEELPEVGLIVTYCQTGARNSVAASTLRSAGYRVAELEGSFSGWVDAGGDSA